MIIDVAKYQGKIDWDALAPALDFAIIKASGKTKDPQFDHNASEASRLGVPWHAYHFLYCTTVVRARKEAQLFSNSVGSFKPLYWVLDCESGWGVAKRKARTIAEAFEAELRRLRGDDIRVAVYIGHNVYKDYALDYSRYAYVWIPRYGVNDGKQHTPPDYPCDLWQYTSKGSAPGISGNVDVNVLTGAKPLSYFTKADESKITTTIILGGETSMAIDYLKYIMSTGTHYISNSGSDESGNLRGGKAGDQSKKEWYLRKWYSRPWTCVLRFPDIIVGTLIAQLGIDAALNDRIGYDQGQRDSFWKEVRKVGYLPAKIVTACEEDCTAGVNGLVHCAAYLLEIPALKKIPETGVRSGNMRRLFKAAGFKVLTDPKYLKSGDYLLPGDVLLYDNHHGATNVTCGKKVRSSYTYRDVIDNLDEYRGKVDPESDGLKRGDSGPEVEAMQQLLLKWEPNCLPEYGADGDFGKETEDAVKAFQKEKGLPVTGVYDAATEKALMETVCGWVEITGGSVNVRAAPGVEAKDIGTVHKGDRLPYQGVTQQAGGRDWYLIIYENQNGWVSSKYAELVNT